MSTLAPELEVAKAVARDAGRILLEVYATDFSVVEKPSGGGPVTVADERANAYIVRELRRAFPGDGVVAEESRDNTDARTASRCWFVDPLDGTREFVNRNGEFAVHVGLAIEGEARLGIVYRPVQERMFWGVVGGECWMESPTHRRALRVSDLTRPEDLRVVVSRSHRNQRALRVQQRLGAPRVMQAGSVGIKCSMIAEGVADVYVHVSARSYRWDCCAPEALLRSAGGRLTDLTGTPYRYDGTELQNVRGLLGCTEAAFERVAAVTREVAREAGLAV
jgi:3'(2'), 5'-bisphosphate nucleotidase